MGISVPFQAGSRLKLAFFFWLPGHRGPFWLVLTTGGAAERAGVPPGARLLEVNGVSVEKFTHNQLRRKVWLPASPLILHPSGPGAPASASRLPPHAPLPLI